MAAMKPLLQEISPLTLAWLRILPAAVILLLAARLLQRPWQVDRRDWPWLLLFALVDGALFHGLLAEGLERTGAGLGSVLIDSQPLLVALLARSLLGKPSTRLVGLAYCWACRGFSVWACQPVLCSTGGSMAPPSMARCFPVPENC